MGKRNVVKETKELKASVTGMLKDRIKRGKPIPESGRKLLGEEVVRKGTIKSYLKKRKEAEKY